jgi:arylsulfatase A-like enzyme
VSFVPLLRGEKMDRGPIYWHYPHYSNQGGGPEGAVRDGDWKLIERYDVGTVELFNVVQDVGEKHEVSAAHPDRVRELRAKLAAWREATGARMPTGR